MRPLIILLLSAHAFAVTHVHLAWQPSTTAGVKQYAVWRSTTSGNGNCNWVGKNGGKPCPYAEIAIGIACCVYDDYNVTVGSTYYYVVSVFAPAPIPATASLTISSTCDGAPKCVKSFTLLTGGSGYDYGFGAPNGAGFLITGGGATQSAVAPNCTNWNGTAYVSAIQSCPAICWKTNNAGNCGGYEGAGYTSTPTVTAAPTIFDHGQMYPAVPGSGVTPYGFSTEASVIYQESGPGKPTPP